MGIQWLSWCRLWTVLWPLEPSILFIKGEKDQWLLVVFAALCHCSPETEDSAVTGALAGVWLILEKRMDTLTVLTYFDIGIWTSWTSLRYCPSVIPLKALTLEDKSLALPTCHRQCVKPLLPTAQPPREAGVHSGWSCDPAGQTLLLQRCTPAPPWNKETTGSLHY